MIYNRWGNPVEIVGNCGRHKPEGFIFDDLLLKLKYLDLGVVMEYTDEDCGYYFRDFLKADNGIQEIHEAIKICERITLSGEELAEAIQEALVKFNVTVCLGDDKIGFEADSRSDVWDKTTNWLTKNSSTAVTVTRHGNCEKWDCVPWTFPPPHPDYKFMYADWQSNLDEGHEGYVADKHTITRDDYGYCPISYLKGLPGACDEHKAFASNPYGNKTKEQWGELMQNIAENDLAYPVTVFVEKNGEVRVWSGFHRLRIAIELGWGKVYTNIRYFGNSQRSLVLYDDGNYIDKTIKISVES